jgi:hypothetical protein
MSRTKVVIKFVTAGGYFYDHCYYQSSCFRTLQDYTVLLLPSSAIDLVVTYLPAVRGMRAASTPALHKDPQQAGPTR